MVRRYVDIVLALLALAWVVFAGVGAFRTPFYGFSADPRSWRIVETAPGSVLRPGDRILELNGRPLEGIKTFFEARAAGKPSAPLEITFERDGKRLHAEQRQVPHPTRWIATQVGGSLLAVLFLAIGLLVAFRPTGRSGQLFFLFCVAVSLLIGGPPQAPAPGVSLAGTVMWAALLFGAAFFLHFFLIFPAPHRFVVRYPWIGAFLYVPPAAFLAVVEGLNIASEVSFVPEVLVERMGRGSVLVALSYMVWAVVAFVDSYRRLDDAVEKEKLRWLVWGVVVSILPAAFVFGLQNVAGVLVPYGDVLELLALLLLPISFGYAILSHRLMDIEIVINRGLVYSAITLVLVVVFIVVENVLASLSLELTGKSSFALAMGSAIVMAALVDPVKKRIQSFIDRMFFAYKVQLREGLKDLTEELSFMNDLERMETLLLRRLSDLALAARAVLFLREREGEGYRLAEAVGIPEWSDARQDGDGAAPRAGPAGFPLEDPEATDGRPRFDPNDPFVIWLLRTPGPLSLETLRDAEFHRRIESAEVSILNRVDAAVALPLRLRGELIGFILLSRRRNRELFNRDELELLNALAIQAAADLTNARLQSRSRRLEEEVVSLREEVLHGLREFLHGTTRPTGRAGLPEARRPGLGAAPDGAIRRGESPA